MKAGRHVPRYIPLAMLMLIAAACGGGGGGGGGSGGGSGGGGGSSSSSSGTSSSSGSSSSSSSSSMSTGSSSGTAFYVPFTGEGGLIAVPSNNPQQTPVILPLTITGYTILGQTFQYEADPFLQNQNISGPRGTPYLLLYAITDLQGIVHIEKADLSDATVPLAPAQVSDLSPPSLAAICSSAALRPDLSSPSMLLVLVQIAGAGGCGSSDDSYQVVNASDSSSASAEPSLIHTTSVAEVFAADGTLGGIIWRDAASNSLLFAKNPTASQTTSIAGVTAENLLLKGRGFDIIEVQDTAGVESIYKVDAAGAATQLYDGAVQLLSFCADDNNFYFADETTTGTAIYKLALAGNVPATLLYQSGTVATNAQYSLVGSNDSTLAFAVKSGTGPTATSTINTISTNPGTVQIPTPSTVIGTYNGSVATFLVEPPGDRQGVEIFVSSFTVDAMNALTGGSSSVVTFDGKTLQSGPNSLWLETADSSNNVLQISGLTFTSGLPSGGVLTSYNSVTNAFAAAPFNGTSGTAFMFPASYNLSLSYLSDTIGEGGLTTTGSDSGLIVDQSGNTVYTISEVGSNVAPLQ